GPITHKDDRLREYGEHARLSWSNLSALGDDALTLSDVLALRTDVRAFRLRLEDADRLQRVLSVLYFQHGVRPFRNRGSGHDPNSLTALHYLGWHLPCRDILDDRQRDGFLNRVFLSDILPAHGKPVHRRIIPGRVITFGHNVLAEHAAQRIKDRNFFQAKNRGCLEHNFLRFRQRR